MYIKRYLLVGYIVSVVIGISWLYYDEVVGLIGLDINKNKEEILFEVYIPRIKLKGIVYNIDSSLNNVDFNIEILDNSNLEKDLYFLASHSGSGNASYFDNLVYLEKGDFIWLSGSDRCYAFMVDEMFYIQKNGYFSVSYNNNGNELFLITCSLRYVDKQLIVRSRLIYKC